MIQTVNNGSGVYAELKNARNEVTAINFIENVSTDFVRALILSNSTSYGRVFSSENPIEGRMFRRMYRKGEKVTFSIVGEVKNVLGVVKADCDPYPKAGGISGHTVDFQICSFKAEGRYCTPDMVRAFADVREYLGSLNERQRAALSGSSTTGAAILAHTAREWITRIGNEIIWGLFFGLENAYTVNIANNAAPFYNAVVPEEFNPQIVNGVNVAGGFVGGLCQNNLVKQMVDAANAPNAATNTSSFYFDTSSMLTPAGAVNALLGAIARFPEKWKNKNFPIEKRLKIWCHPIIADLVRNYYVTQDGQVAGAYSNLMQRLLGMDGLSTDIAMLDWHYPVIPVSAWNEFDDMRGAMKTTTIGGVPVYHSRNLMVMIGFDGFSGAMTTYEDEAEAGTYGMQAQIPYSIKERQFYDVTASVEYSAGTIAHKNNPFAIGYPATQTFS